MDAADRQRLYDEIAELEKNDQPVVLRYLELLYDICETPEELLAAKVVDGSAYTPLNDRPTKNYSTFAAVRWPWGDARGIIRVGGRGYFEARLRLRDKLVESARELTTTSTARP